MGAGIAEVCARAGVDVVVCESNREAVEAGRDRLRSSLERAESKGKISSAADVLDRVRFGDDLGAMHDRELVVEAISEDEAAKIHLFRALDGIVSSPEAILASNTSSIPIMKLAVATSRPTHVIGIHFFNPVPVLPLVELVPSLLTSPDTARRARTFAEDVDPVGELQG
jgi:3-hydroxybutyryl-CoA dehydrogenase